MPRENELFASQSRNRIAAGDDLWPAQGTEVAEKVGSVSQSCYEQIVAELRDVVEQLVSASRAPCGHFRAGPLAARDMRVR